MGYFLSLLVWLLVPYLGGFISFEMGPLPLFCTRLGVYSIIIAGWSSTSGYSLLGDCVLRLKLFLMRLHWLLFYSLSLFWIVDIIWLIFIFFRFIYDYFPFSSFVICLVYFLVS